MKKNILLIGGSYGIGLAIIKELEKDYTIYVASRTNDELSDLNVTHISFDAVSDTLDTSQLPDELHGFVFCPGSINLKPFKMLPIEAFQKDMEVNFFSLVKVMHLIIDKMVENSSMVFFSSVAVNKGMPFHTSIAASKGAIEGFAKSIAAEYAPKIRCNVIAPSITNTPLAKRLLNNDKKIDLMASRHPLNRVGHVVDIANMATFLIKEKSAWMTGQIINIDGGLSTLNVN
ncbi:SDR family oxidoreductase [Cellulophaga baltica]|uniref:SDR family NAD(P)-dependent oxidoreductase n=1 Tax=Cellulophaga TaxID=104264 RepID=UPI001C0650CC|nr:MULTISPECIES: SDR family oxidoreductase [Cellulophaga]MBU2997315.1 SDR family oxidoreductase [Cellulophaga baltica]MDO6768713.1 SDR family oxidoreductase [Cellulophaga sp. 1_MG-2023]